MQSPMESQDALVGREAELDAVEVTAKLFARRTVRFPTRSSTCDRCRGARP
jgi:hypothetical protein